AKMATYVEFFLVVLFSYLCLAIQKTSLTNTVSLEDTAKVIFIGMNIFLLLMVNVCPKITPNKWLGIRTPYAFSSDEAWVRVQRLGGRFLFCGSLFNILVTLFLPGSFPVIFIFNMASLLLQALVIFLWKPHRNRTEIPPSSGSGAC
ncbi:SdpI family protein, partial [Akkermansia sp.]